MTVEKEESLPQLRITREGKLHVKWRLSSGIAVRPAVTFSVNGLLIRTSTTNDYNGYMSLDFKPLGNKNSDPKISGFVSIGGSEKTLKLQSGSFEYDHYARGNWRNWASKRAQILAVVDIDVLSAQTIAQTQLRFKAIGDRHAMQTLNADDQFKDLTISPSDKRAFPCHRAVFASTSPVFKKMLTSGMKESESKRIEFPTYPSEVINVFLKLAYGFETSISVDHFESLLDFTSMYEVALLADAIRDWVQTVNVSQLSDHLVITVLCHYTKISKCVPDKAGKDAVIVKFVDRANKQLPGWIFQDWFKTLPYDDIFSIFKTIKSTECLVETIIEKVLDPWVWFHFEAIRIWIEAQADEKFDADTYADLIEELIDFGKMTLTQLLVISKLPLLKKLPTIAFLVIEAMCDWQ